jgi:hypothetical protein
MKNSVVTYVRPGNVSKFPLSRWNASEIRGIATGNETCWDVEDVDR